MSWHDKYILKETETIDWDKQDEEKESEKKEKEKELQDSIEELEYLIGDSAAEELPDDGLTEIPVLDEVVDPEDYISGNFLLNAGDADDMPVVYQAPETTEREIISDEHIAELLQNVEEKITDDLDELVELLKDTIKDSILSELKSELKSEFNHPTNTDKELKR